MNAALTRTSLSNFAPNILGLTVWKAETLLLVSVLYKSICPYVFCASKIPRSIPESFNFGRGSFCSRNTVRVPGKEICNIINETESSTLVTSAVF